MRQMGKDAQRIALIRAEISWLSKAAHLLRSPKHAKRLKTAFVRSHRATKEFEFKKIEKAMILFNMHLNHFIEDLLKFKEENQELRAQIEKFRPPKTQSFSPLAVGTAQ